MQVIINGKAETIENNEITVAQLLKLKDVEMPDMVSVQLNGEFVDRNTFDTTPVEENNEIDFLYFMGGGR